MADKVVLELVAEGNAIKIIRQTTEAADKFGKKADESAKKASSAFAVFQGVLGANAFTGAVRGAFNATSNFFEHLVVDGVKAAQVQENAVNQLSVAMRLNGDFSRAALDDMLQFASGLQATSVFGDEATLSMLALAKSYGRSNEETRKLVQAATELSAATGMSLESAVRNLGKTYAGMTGELGESLPIIRTLTAEQLKAGGALDLIINRFGGSALGQVQTFSGATAQLSNVWGDFQEQIGFAITKNASLVNVTGEANRIIQEMTGSLGENQGEMATFVSDGVILAIEGVQALVYAFEFLQRTGSVVIEGLSTIVLSFGAVAAKVASIFDSSFESVAVSLEQASYRSQQAIANAFSEELLAEKLDPYVERLKSAAQDGYGQLIDASDKFAERELDNRNKLNDQSAADAEAEAQKRDARLQELFQETENLKKLDEDLHASRISANEKEMKTLTSQSDRYSKAVISIELARKQQQEQIDRQTAANRMATLSMLASFQGSKIRELAVIGKAAAIADTTIKTYESAQLAFTSLAGIPFVGPVLGAAAAAAAIAGGIARVAQISSTPLPAANLQTGITEVPAGFPNDTFRANLTSGERVVDAGTNQDLKADLRQRAGQTAILQSIDRKLSAMGGPTIIELDGRQLVYALRDQAQGGRKLAI